MKCQITGMPDQKIDPPEYEDDSQSPEDLVQSYLIGDEKSFIDLDKVKDCVLASDFKSFIEMYRYFKSDKCLTLEEYRGELLLLIDEYLTETIVDYIK